MARLIGIPFGPKKPPEEADCISLVVYAQEVLWGRHIDMTGIDAAWTTDNIRAVSQRTREIIPQFCDEVSEPEVGDIILTTTLGYCHALTLVEPDLILHTGIDSSSRLSRYRPRRDMTFWRVKGREVSRCQHC